MLSLWLLSLNMARTACVLLLGLAGLLTCFGSDAATPLDLVAPNPNASVDGATEEIDDLLTADLGDSNLFKTRPAPGQVPSEFAAVEGQLGTFTNPNVALPLDLLIGTPYTARYVDDEASAMWTCLNHSPWYGPGAAALDADDQVGLKSILRLYVLAALTEGALMQRYAGAVVCDDLSLSNLSLTTLGMMIFKAQVPRGLIGLGPETDSTSALTDFLKRMRQRGASQTDIITLYVLEHFGPAFRTDTVLVQSAFTAFNDPTSLLSTKTTPSLDFNNSVAQQLSQVVPWKELGMNSYSALGYSTISAWIAEKNYAHPVLFSLMPVIGPAFEALDNFESLREGKNAAGMSQDRLFSAAMMTIQTVSAILDVPTAQALMKNTVVGMKVLAKSARQAKTADEAVLKLQAMSKLLKGSVSKSGYAVGQAGLDAWQLTGRPVKMAEGLVNRALGHTVAQSGSYVKAMGRGMTEVLFEMQWLSKTRRLPSTDVDKVIWLREQLDKLARSRRLGAAGDIDNAQFGVLAYDRLQGLETSMNRSYPSSLKDMLDRFAMKGTKRVIPISTPALPKPPVVFFQNQMRGVLPDGTELPFGMVMSNANGQTKVVHWARDWIPISGPPTVAPFAEKGLTYVARMTIEAMNPATSKARATELGARIFYWLSNLTPYVRGSNTIADAFSRTVLRFRGIRTGMWKSEVSADFWAMTHTEDEFVQLFTSGALHDRLDGLAATDLTKLPGPRGFGNNAPSKYPPGPVLPLVEGAATVNVTGSAKVAIGGYVASRVLTYSQPDESGQTKIESIVQYVRMSLTYTNGTPNEMVVLPADQISPPGTPANLLANGGGHAGFNFELNSSQVAAWNSGTLIVDVDTMDSYFTDEHITLGKFKKYNSLSHCPAFPDSFTLTVVKSDNPTRVGLTAKMNRLIPVSGDLFSGSDCTAEYVPSFITSKLIWIAPSDSSLLNFGVASSTSDDRQFSNIQTVADRVTRSDIEGGTSLWLFSNGESLRNANGSRWDFSELVSITH